MAAAPPAKPRTAPIVVLAGDNPPGVVALTWAENELAAGDAGQRLVLCRISPEPSEIHAALPAVDRPDLIDSAFDRLVRRTRDRNGGESVDTVVCHGHAGTALATLAGSTGTIVVPAPPAGASPLIVDLIAHATGPFVGVRRTTPPPHVTAGPFAGQVILGVGDSDTEHNAIEYAFAWADRHHKPLCAVRAAAADSDGVWIDDELMETHPLGHEFGLDVLDGAIEAAHLAHPRVHVRRAVIDAPPGKALVRASTGALLLVVGERRRNTIARHLSTSVSRYTLLHAHCTVAVVPHRI